MLPILIIGNGITAYLLANELLKSGRMVRVIGKSKPGEASRISSGLINPVTGRRFVKTWKYDELERVFIPFYRSLEVQYHQKIIFNHELLIQLETVEQENDWMKRLTDPVYENICSWFDKKQHSIFDLDLKRNYGLIKNVFRINIPLLMQLIEQELTQFGHIENEIFIYDDLQIESTYVSYQDVNYDRVIFCEGVFVKSNPFFSYLPVFCVKGERSLFGSNKTTNHILSAQYGIIALNECFWVGSNYSFDDQSECITAAEAEGHEMFFRKHMNSEDIKTDQNYGFRPSSRDRRPIVGQHPKFERLYILNGMGTKATSLLPYCIKIMLNHFESGDQFPIELSPKRFVKKGFQFN
ncbi:MAG: FAD-dependent oxidoreductase [Saprospiraceae bacterium]|nr:FAD-dependent oxidoreductase [Saprospiraceae bacterium]